VFASLPDLLRLVAVPFFAWVAYTDVKTRRVANRVWYPLAGLAVVLLVWDALALFGGDASAFARQRFLVGVAFSLLFVVPLVYVFWAVGGFGGADAKAFFVIAVLFPVFPDYNLWELGYTGLELPVVRPSLPVFSLTILSNTVLAGIVYPLVLAARNAAAGQVSPGMFIARPARWDAIPEAYGTLMEFPDRPITADLSVSGLRSYFAWRGLDIDALRMYLRWRGLTLADLRADPERYRDPASLPDEPNDPGDGALVADGGRAVEGDRSAAGTTTADPWGADAFLDDIEGSAYGTTPADLRAGLERLTTEETVWFSPGIPFLVPLFAGLCLALTVGDLLFVALGVVGLV
jgi:preflagellin peptidase FlaK